MTKDSKKAALVTGATKGIGLALTKKLLQEGWVVYGTGRDEKSLNDIQKDYSHFIPIHADFSQNADIKNVAKIIQDNHYPLMLCVQNAGMKSPPRSLDHYDCESIDEVFNVNLLAPMKLTALLTKLMPEESRLLYITSRAATLRLKESITYCASKAGLNEMAAILREELEDKKIGVGCIIPGEVDTQIQKILRETTTFHLHQQFIQAYESGHLISPDVCAEFLKWLLCDMPFSDYINSPIPLSIYDEFHQKFWLKDKKDLPLFPEALV